MLHLASFAAGCFAASVPTLLFVVLHVQRIVDRCLRLWKASHNQRRGRGRHHRGRGGHHLCLVHACLLPRPALVRSYQDPTHTRRDSPLDPRGLTAEVLTHVLQGAPIIIWTRNIKCECTMVNTSCDGRNARHPSGLAGYCFSPERACEPVTAATDQALHDTYSL